MTRIGRYEIVGPLATGGMAEIHLARLLGPSGFERAVVVKRLLPAAKQEEVRELILQEARLVARIRHANVVQVEDLGTDESGRPYLVMEYLEGESVTNLLRRAVSRKDLPPGLSAFIIAEACAGLHAAHELRDRDDKPIGLVHRDVSPNNVLVTYAGAVKVIDFGVAKQTALSEHTTPGIVRGTTAYLSPEQMKSEPMDRRADVFSLGVVLYELLTGHRLFKRFSVAATIRAITTDPILPPSRVHPGVPPSLEAICMKALARRREDRFATAAEMRRELLIALRGLASEDPAAELAELMVGMFPERIEEKRAMLREVRAGNFVEHVAVGEVDLKTELPEVGDSTTATAGGTESIVSVTLTPKTELPAAPPPAPRFARTGALVAVALLSASAAIGVGFLVQRPPRAARLPPPDVPAQSSPAASEPEPSAAPLETATAESAPADAPSAASSIALSPRPSRRATPASRRVPPHTAPPEAPPPPPAPAPEPSASVRGYHRFQ